MTLSIWLDDEDTKPNLDCDIAIIGGGIMGSGCAFWLSQKQGLKTVLVESGKTASGATGRNAGFLLRGLHTYYNEAAKTLGRDQARSIFQFTEENLALVKEFIAKFGNNCRFAQNGSYLLACSLEELQDLNESAQLMYEDGFTVEYLKTDPLDRNYFGAMFNECDAEVHPVKLVRSLLAAAQTMDANKGNSALQVFEDEPVLRLEAIGGSGLSSQSGIKIVTARRTITCQKVLLATNAYSPLLEPWFTNKLRPVRGQIFVTQPLKKRVLEKICYANYGWEYFRQLPDNRFLLGGCRQLHINEEVGYADTTTPALQASLEHYLKDRFPEVAGVPIEHRWSGTMAFTEDGLPLVGELKHLPGVYFAVGFNGHGMSYGINMAKLLVNLALDNASPGPFAAGRLQKEHKDGKEQKSESKTAAVSLKESP